MTSEDRVRAVAHFGFTERQARFLVSVMQHSAVCVPRQYAAFAGVVQGQKTCAFFSKLIEHDYASIFRCLHNRGRVYHVQHKALYRAIDSPHSRFRRPVPVSCVVGRLMMLDAVLSSCDVDWLTAKHDSIRRGRDGSGRTVLLIVITSPTAADLRHVIRLQVSVLANLPSWTLRLVLPRSFEQFYTSFQTVIDEELERPLQRATVAALRAYCEHRRASANEPAEGAQVGPAPLSFDGPRFDALYRAWLKDGERAFEVASSRAIAEALDSGVGRVECRVLPHQYRHLSPLVALTHQAAAQAEKRAECPATREATSPAPPQPSLKKDAMASMKGLSQ